MKLLVSLLFIISFSDITAQIVPSDCTPTPALDSLLKESAIMLSVTESVRRQPDTLKIPVELNSLLVDTIFKGLIAIYNSGFKEADTLFKGVKIKPMKVVKPDLREIFIGVITKTGLRIPWLDSLYKNKIIPTGSALLDSVFNNYFFIIKDTVRYSFGYTMKVIFSRNLNLYPIIKTLRNAGTNVEARHGTENYIWTDFETIVDSYKRENGYDEFVFGTGWGDCPAGCMYQRQWKFYVYPGCSVEFKGATGSSFFKVGINEIGNKENYKIYPQPFTNTFSIDGDLSLIEKLEIKDLSGKSVMEINCVTPEINAQGLAQGVYLLYIYERNTYNVMKIIKN